MLIFSLFLILSFLSISSSSSPSRSESESISSTNNESESVKDVLNKEKIEQIFLTMNDLKEVSVSAINNKDYYTIEFYVEENLMSMTQKTKTRYYIKENDITYLIEKENDVWVKKEIEEVNFSLSFCFDFTSITIGDDLIINDNKATFSDVNYGNVTITFINDLVYSFKTTNDDNQTILNYIFTTGKKTITLPEVN